MPVTSAPRPGWHGVPPSADRYVPPLQLNAPNGPATEPEKAPALWVELEHPPNFAAPRTIAALHNLAIATSDFAEAIASLAASDLSKQLSHALERLADIGRRSRDVHEDNAKGDVRTFMSTGESRFFLPFSFSP